jgi:hypothetical protein
LPVTARPGIIAKRADIRRGDGLHGILAPHALGQRGQGRADLLAVVDRQPGGVALERLDGLAQGAAYGSLDAEILPAPVVRLLALKNVERVLLAPARGELALSLAADVPGDLDARLGVRLAVRAGCLVPTVAVTVGADAPIASLLGIAASELHDSSSG